MDVTVTSHKSSHETIKRLVSPYRYQQRTKLNKWKGGKKRKIPSRSHVQMVDMTCTFARVASGYPRSLIGAICITFIRQYLPTVRARACPPWHMRLSVHILIGSIGYVRWQYRQYPAIWYWNARVLWSFANQIRLRSFHVRLFSFPSLSPMFYTVITECPFLEGTFVLRAPRRLVTALILPWAFSAPGVSLS